MSIPSSGSSTTRSASNTSSRVGMHASVPDAASAYPWRPDLLAALAGEEMDAVDEAHPVAARAHDERLRPRRVGEVADAAQQVAARDAGRGDDDVARRELLDREHLLHVLEAELARLGDLACARRARTAPGARRRGSGARRRRSPPAGRRRCRSRDGRSCRGSRQLIAAFTSPSWMSLIRAPDWRSSSTRS